jgi:hypothetical protein
MVCSRKEQRTFLEGIGSSVRDPELTFPRPRARRQSTFARLLHTQCHDDPRKRMFESDKPARSPLWGSASRRAPYGSNNTAGHDC